MKLTYKCPVCNAAINAKRNIIITAVDTKDKENKGLVLLHEELGNYTVATSATFIANTGDIVDFYCPICHASLNSEKAENLASFIQENELGEETTIVISRVYGERCTFQVDDKKQVKTYGESVKKYLNPEWFLK